MYPIRAYYVPPGKNDLNVVYHCLARSKCRPGKCIPLLKKQRIVVNKQYERHHERKCEGTIVFIYPDQTLIARCYTHRYVRLILMFLCD